MAEHFNKTLAICARLLVNAKTIGTKNNLVHDGIHVSLAGITGQTPTSIIFGKEMRLPSGVQVATSAERTTFGGEFEVNDYADDLRQNLLTVHAQLKNKIRLRATE